MMCLFFWCALAQAEMPGPVLTPAQQKLVAQDSCAEAALHAATSAFVDEIKSEGTDLPEKIYVESLRPVQAGSEYDVRFVGGDSTFQAQTKMGKAKCRYTTVGAVP
jgi:hypothetical protein